MKKTAKKIIILTFAAVILGGMTSTSTVYASPKEEDITVSQKLGNAQDELAKINNKISDNTKEKEDLEREIDESKEKIEETKVLLKETEEEILRLRDFAGKNMRAIQLNPQPMTMTILNAALSGRSLTDIVALTESINKIMQTQNENFEKLRDKQGVIETKEKELVSEQKSLLNSEEKLEKTSKELDKEKKEVAAKVKKLQEEVKKEEERAARSTRSVGSPDFSNFNFEDSIYNQQFEISEVSEKVEVAEASLIEPAIELTVGPTVSQSGNRAVVEESFKYLGVPYVWGGKTPSGFDCSGFTSWVFKNAVGYEMHSYTVSQESHGYNVSMSELVPGDLLFWGGAGASYHVAIYIGQGQYIHAPTPGQSVKVTALSDWAPNFAKRVL